MRSFCCGSISAKSDVLGATCQSASSESLASVLAREHRRRVEPDRLGEMARHEAVVPRDDLDLDVELREIAEHARRVGLGRVEEEQEAREDHLRLVVAAIGAPGRDGARGESEHAEARLALRLVVRRELGGDGGRQRKHGAVALDLRADREHVRERALRDDEVPGGVAALGHDDRQALPQEVVRDLVDLGVAGGRKPRVLPRRDDRGVDRVVDSRLEGGVQERELADGRRRDALRIGRVLEDDRPLGQRAGLVGAQHVHAAEVLDRVEPTDDDALPAHGARAGRERHADDRGQEFGREPDGERDREEERLDERTVEEQVHRQDEEDHHDHRADQEVAELPEPVGEVGLRRPRAQSRRDRAERRAPPGLDDERRAPSRCAPRRRGRPRSSAGRAARPRARRPPASPPGTTRPSCSPR